jgi:hypothetical protein
MQREDSAFVGSGAFEFHRQPLPARRWAAPQRLDKTPAAAEWWAGDPATALWQRKRAQIEALQTMDENELCRRHVDAH